MEYQQDMDDILRTSNNVEEIYGLLKMQATRGTRVLSLGAPALATQFVKSSMQRKARPNEEGPIAEISFPSRSDINQKNDDKHGSHSLFDYKSTAASDAYPLGYGERAAQALAREDNVYQLKGKFPSAVQSFSRLRARVDARKGSTECVDRIFARFWGLDVVEVEQLPRLVVAGNEATRMSAMEDRAYHNLSGHPGHTGGFRVDMATLAQDAIGESVPLNWARIRTGLKTIAHIQVNADISLSEALETVDLTHPTRLYMSLSEHSQPPYERSAPWELIIDDILNPDGPESQRANISIDDITMKQAMRDKVLAELKRHIPRTDLLSSQVSKVATLVTRESNQAITETIQAITMFDDDRALIEHSHEVEHDELVASSITRRFTIPQYKLTRSSLKTGMKVERLGPDDLPDIRSHGKGMSQLNRSELRASGNVHEVQPSGALNLAIFMMIHQLKSAVASYKLLMLVRDPNPSGPGKVSVRLRHQHLYDDPRIRELGKELFNSSFVGILGSVLRNMVTRDGDSDESIKSSLWAYLSHRSAKSRACPVTGGWRDLIDFLVEAPEGWTLYYWARVSMGKLQHTISSDILAPIAAGEDVDFITLIQRGAKTRATHWKHFYAAKTALISGEIKAKHDRIEKLEKKKRKEEEGNEISHYIPPHARDRAHLEMSLDKATYLNRLGGFSQEEYENMVEAQVKSRVFGAIEVSVRDRDIVLGVSDKSVLDMLIEFYQARWYSLRVRIDKAKERGTVFRLGPHELTEHPWGELVTELPSTMSEMFEFMRSLDSLAWTIPPDYLWERVRKSVSELWTDIGDEISKIMVYILDMHQVSHDEHVEAACVDRVGKLLKGMHGIQAIVLPTPGYTAPHMLPQRASTLYSDKGETEIHHTGRAMVPDSILPAQVTGNSPTLSAPKKRMSMSRFASMKTSHDLTPVARSRLLSFTEIWAALGLDEVPRDKKVFALGLPADTDLDAPHGDPSYGPTVTTSEVEGIAKMWVSKMPFIRKRLGVGEAVHFDDDMK